MSGPLTIRQHIMCIQAIADRIDQDWLPSRSSDALVLELRAIADGALALMDEAVRDYIEGDGNCVLVIDPPRAEA